MTTTKPSKEKVREVMAQHRKDKALPATNEEYRRQLSWNMLPNNKRAECAR